VAIARMMAQSDAVPQKLMVVNRVETTASIEPKMFEASFEQTPISASELISEAPAVARKPPAEPPIPFVAIDEPTPLPASEQMAFGGRPLRYVRTMRMVVTAYSPDEKSCGKFADNITASGFSVWTNGMKLVAADTSVLPFKSVITVPGYNGGRPVPVLDRGGKIKGNRLDVLYPTHEIASRWGRQTLDIDVWEYAD